MRFAGGYLMVDDVRIVDESKLTKADARRAGFESLDMLRAELAKGGDGETYRIALHWDGEDERIALAIGRRAERRRARRDRGEARAARQSEHPRPVDADHAHPHLRAPRRARSDLAASLGLETLVFKRDVRKLKALGLTESLTVGYRISPRGQVLLARSQRRD